MRGAAHATAPQKNLWDDALGLFIKTGTPDKAEKELRAARAPPIRIRAQQETNPWNAFGAAITDGVGNAVNNGISLFQQPQANTELLPPAKGLMADPRTQMNAARALAARRPPESNAKPPPDILSSDTLLDRLLDVDKTRTISSDFTGSLLSRNRVASSQGARLRKSIVCFRYNKHTTALLADPPQLARGTSNDVRTLEKVFENYSQNASNNVVIKYPLKKLIEVPIVLEQLDRLIALMNAERNAVSKLWQGNNEQVWNRLLALLQQHRNYINDVYNVHYLRKSPQEQAAIREHCKADDQRQFKANRSQGFRDDNRIKNETSDKEKRAARHAERNKERKEQAQDALEKKELPVVLHILERQKRRAKAASEYERRQK